MPQLSSALPLFSLRLCSEWALFIAFLEIIETIDNEQLYSGFQINK
jgi:hypothetical protein